MGYRLGVVRRPVVQAHTLRTTLVAAPQAPLEPAEPRQHAGVAPTIERNVKRLSDLVTGQPHDHNLHRWRDLIDRGDLPGLHRVLTGLDRDSVEMREVSPMGGLLT